MRFRVRETDAFSSIVRRNEENFSFFPNWTRLAGKTWSIVDRYDKWEKLLADCYSDLIVITLHDGNWYYRRNFASPGFPTLININK